MFFNAGVSTSNKLRTSAANITASEGHASVKKKLFTDPILWGSVPKVALGLKV